MTNRNGFTFIEMLLVMIIGMVVLGGAYNTLIKQEQAYDQMHAMAGVHEDSRTGLELLVAELREITTDTATSPVATDAGIDLLTATPDSMRFRALRKFGILCSSDKNNKRLLVSEVGAAEFAVGDTLLIYVDQDSLLAEDDLWQKEVVQSVSSAPLCTTPLGLSLATILPGGELTPDLTLLTLQGAALKFDSIFPGAPVRSFETLTYKSDDSSGEPMLSVVRNDSVFPVVGPLASGDGLEFRYFDEAGTELTATPLSLTDRRRVRRVRIIVRAERPAGSAVGTYGDSLFTDVWLRGS